MKKAFIVFVSLIICTGILCASPTVGAVKTAYSADINIEVSEQTESNFNKFVNVLIDVIHRVITFFRYPWEPKSGKTVDMSKFSLTFEDEFDGTEKNDKFWSSSRQGERKGGYWDSEQSFVRDGNLIIRAEYKDGKYGSGYYCDGINTSKGFNQAYGYFECRCILPAAQGLWSAFWLTAVGIGDYVPGEQGTEIDVFESPMWYRGNMGLENNLVTSNLHYGGYKLGHRYSNVAVSKAVNPYTQYNTYGVEWNDTEYIFYVNGVETGRSSFGGVSKVPEYLRLSVEIDGVDGKPYHGWSGIVTANEPDAIPAEFVVDYVRVYQYNDLLEK